MNLAGICAILILCSFGCTRAESTLRAVSLLFRHGDRAPLSRYPNDLHANYSWPGGLGAVSTKGLEQLYISGSLKAKRYSILLRNDSYQLPEIERIYAQSSHTPRCVQSAKSFLDGFLQVKWPANLLIVLPKKDDEILRVAGKYCPKYDFPFEDVIDYHDPEVLKLLRDDDDFFNYLSNKTGLAPTILRVSLIVDDIFKVHLDNGLALPDWADPIYEPIIKPLGDIYFKRWANSTRMHVRSGALLKDIIDRLQAVTNGARQNILLYSGHDITIGALLNHLDLSEQVPVKPDYGSSLALEVYENDKLKDDYEVKMLFFRNFEDVDPVPLFLAECETPCPFEKLISMITPKFTVDYEETCRLE